MATFESGGIGGTRVHSKNNYSETVMGVSWRDRTAWTGPNLRESNGNACRACGTIGGGGGKGRGLVGK